MSLEQKVNFVTSLVMYESSPAGHYEFPVFKLTNQPNDGCSEICATRFPSDKALASTWNSRLVSDVYNAIGEETRRVHPFGYFNNTDDYTSENVSNDNFVTAKFILARTLGLTKSGQAVNFEKTHIEDGEHTYDKKFITDTLLDGAKPTSVLVKDHADIENITKKFKYNGLFYGIASSTKECVRLLLEGCSLVFLTDDFTPELVNFLTERTEAYRKAYKSFRDEDIKLGDFDRRVRKLEIFDEEIIDRACDRLISLLLDMKAGGDNIPELSALSENRVAKFDEFSHDELALAAARESVVLIKNDGILPLNRQTRLAVAGEYANDFSYQKELFGGNPTVEMLPFDVINEYDGIVTTGFVAGYQKGMSGRADLIGSAVELGGKSDCMLVYLCAGKGETCLPPEQLELIDSLYARGLGIIAVVACDKNIDLSFADKCKALLLTYNGGQEVTAAALDILTGLVSPSGKLTEEIVRPNGEVMYPFGYGLSFTQFEYHSLKVNSNGVSFSVKNIGEYDGYASAQLYIRKEDATNFFANKTLRGFAKIFVRKGDAINVEIPFDENTFKAFNDGKKCYAIEGGDYEIIIAENYDSDKLSGTVTLAGHIYKDIFENELVESSSGADIAFTGDKEKNEYIKARKKLSFGVKLFLALMLGVYYNVLIGVFAFTPIIDKNLFVYIILGVLAVIFDIILIIYIIVIAKNRKKQRYIPENDVLTDMLGQVDEFKEIAKVTYVNPVKGKEEESVESADDLDPFGLKKNEEVAELTFDASLDESEEEVVFTEHISLAEMCTNLREFVLSYGVNVEISSVRAIIAASAASKIVVLKSANTEMLPTFLEALSAYFGSGAVSDAWADWKNADDIKWKIEGDKYVLSDFVNEVYAAVKAPAKRCAAILRNVNAENIKDYFGNFINYANHPSEKYEFVISDELTINLPNNITYFIVPEEGSKPLPREIINGSLTVELALSRAEKGGEVEVKNVACAEFDDLVKAAREEAYISEKVWKKIDELVATINSSDRFKLGNKSTLQIEKLTSVILECGGDEAEAFTQMFVCKIVPLLKTTRTYRQDGGDRTLSGIIEKLFPEEELAKIQKALVKIN